MTAGAVLVAHLDTPAIISHFVPDGVFVAEVKAYGFESSVGSGSDLYVDPCLTTCKGEVAVSCAEECLGNERSPLSFSDGDKFAFSVGSTDGGFVRADLLDVPVHSK